MGIKRWICLLLCIGLLQSAAGAAPDLGALNAKSAALYAANGQQLYAFEQDMPLQPASVTKIMTMLLAMEALSRGEVALDTMITGSEYACSMGGTQIWLEPGEQLSFDEMMKAIAVGSANDCAVAMAEHLAGTELAFVERMNERAAALGCTGTKFINANGLDGIGEKTMTTAHDLALISCELLRHPKILDYTSIWMDSVRGGKFVLANTNKMLKSYPGLNGLKTGYISEAGFCISASAVRDGLTLVAVVMAAPTKEARMADATALLDYGFANFTKLQPAPEALQPVPVTLGQEKSVPILMQGESELVIEKAAAKELQTELTLPDSVRAPIAKGQQLGTLTIKNGEAELFSAPLIAEREVAAQALPEVLRRFLQGLCAVE